MVPADVFRDQPVLTGDLVELRPLDAVSGAPLVASLVDMDPEVRRLTGTHRRFTREVAQEWNRTRPDHHDRADWVIVERAGGTAVGDCALIGLDPDNASVGYRIALTGLGHAGKGYGTAATDLVLEYAFTVAGLHRVALEVFDFNPRARRSYEKSGFVREGVWRQALHWDGEWHDAVLMSVLAHEYAALRAGGGSAAGGR